MPIAEADTLTARRAAALTEHCQRSAERAAVLADFSRRLIAPYLGASATSAQGRALLFFRL